VVSNGTTAIRLVSRRAKRTPPNLLERYLHPVAM
jgi:hypothetical protein